jgi:hypothetical protein
LVIGFSEAWAQASDERKLGWNACGVIGVSSSGGSPSESAIGNLRYRTLESMPYKSKTSLPRSVILGHLIPAGTAFNPHLKKEDQTPGPTASRDRTVGIAIASRRIAAKRSGPAGRGISSIGVPPMEKFSHTNTPAVDSDPRLECF